MSPSVFRYTRGYRVTCLFVSAAILGLAIGLAVTFFPAGGFPYSLSWLLAIPILMPLLAFLPLAYTTVFSWTYRLEFGDREMWTRQVYHPTLRRFRCAYDDIGQVRRAGGGLIQVVPRTGEAFLLAGGVLQGGEKGLLAELARHVDSSLLPGGKAAISPRLRRRTRLGIAFMIVLLVFPLGWLYMQLGHPLLLRQVAWHAAGRPYLFASGVDVLALDADGNPWFVYQAGPDAPYQVEHPTSAGSRIWRMPPETANWGEFGWPRGVAWDAAGRPTAVFDHYLLRWTGETWQMSPFPLPGMEVKVSALELFTWDTTVWATAYSDSGERQLLEIDLSAGTWRLVPLPDAAVEKGLTVHSMRILPDGSLLVLLWTRGDYYVYRYHSGRWLPVGDAALPQQVGPVQDLALDAGGQLWVLAMRDPSGGPQQLGTLDPTTGTWQWGEVPAASGEFSLLQVDARGRVWLAGGGKAEDSWREYLQVVEFVPGAAARPIVRYAQDNSGYQGVSYAGRALRLGPDGRMWAAGKVLAWIDSNASALPSPLPAWIEWFARDEVGLVWMGTYLLLQVVFLGALFASRRQLYQGEPSP